MTTTGEIRLRRRPAGRRLAALRVWPRAQERLSAARHQRARRRRAGTGPGPSAHGD